MDTVGVRYVSGHRGSGTEPVFADVAEHYKHLPQPSPTEQQQLHAQTWFDPFTLIR